MVYRQRHVSHKGRYNEINASFSLQNTKEETKSTQKIDFNI